MALVADEFACGLSRGQLRTARHLPSRLAQEAAMRDGGTGGWTATRLLRAALALVVGIALILLSPRVPQEGEYIVREIGAALLVAVVIWVTFLALSQAEEEEHWRRRIERITGDIFYGVLRRSLPKALLAEANRLVLDQLFVTKYLTLEYVLEDDTYRPAGEEVGPYVKVSAALRFTVVNISDAPQSFPIAVSVSNPFEPGLKEQCDVPSVVLVQHGQRRDLDISGARARFRLAMARSTAASVTCLCGQIALEAGEEAEVDLRYVMAKREEDTDSFEALHPADSLRVMIVDRGPQGRRIGANARHPGELEDQTLTPNGGPFQYRLNRYLLPHQGVSIWWRKLALPS
jgi:hypothetical protein